MQVFGLSEAQSILCPSPALPCLVGPLPYITLHLLSTGIQVDSASGRPWMDWSMGEGEKPEYFSLPHLPQGRVVVPQAAAASSLLVTLGR